MCGEADLEETYAEEKEQLNISSYTAGRNRALGERWKKEQRRAGEK